MFHHLQISDPRERALIGSVDLALGAFLAPARIFRRSPTGPIRRILLLRLERIGDLLMTLDAIAAVRRHAPEAEIDLVVGSWNFSLAQLIPDIDRIETLDAPWLARETRGTSRARIVAQALAWRRRRYDLALNFEPDLRSNLMLAVSGARRKAGFGSGGGGALLTDSLAYDPREHTAVNALRLVGQAFEAQILSQILSPAAAAPSRLLLDVPPQTRGRVHAMLVVTGVLLGVHPGSGRQVKQWNPDRFAEVAARLAAQTSATIVLTGSTGDEPVVRHFRAALPTDTPVIDLAGRLVLVELAAVFERLAVLITGDTGPMHLAAAVGTPVVAVFGPSDPARYAPRTAHRLVRIDLPCSPCNRIRRPPARCVGHTPDCLHGIAAQRVYAATLDLLHEVGVHSLAEQRRS